MRKVSPRFQTPGCVDMEAARVGYLAAGGTLYALPPVIMASEVTRRIFDLSLWTPGWDEHDVLRGL